VQVLIAIVLGEALEREPVDGAPASRMPENCDLRPL